MATNEKSGTNEEKEYFKGVPSVWVLYSIVLLSLNAGVFLVSGLRHWESDPLLHLVFLVVAGAQLFAAIFSGLRLIAKLQGHRNAETSSDVNANAFD